MYLLASHLTVTLPWPAPVGGGRVRAAAAVAVTVTCQMFAAYPEARCSLSYLPNPFTEQHVSPVR